MTRESIHRKLQRVGRRTVPSLTYEVQVGDATVLKSLPFIVGVLADLSGQPDEPLRRLQERNFADVDRDNFQAVLAAMKPRLGYQVDNELRQDGSQLNVELKFSCLDDFGPEEVARRVEPLRRLLEARQWLDSIVVRFYPSRRPKVVLEGIGEEDDKPGLEPGGNHPSPGTPRWNLDDVLSLQDLIFNQSGADFDDDSGWRLLKLMGVTADATFRPHDGASGDGLDVIQSFLRRIDNGLSRQLDAILHHPEFQRLEATWRGLHYLVWLSETCSTLKIRVLNVSKSELLRDMERALDFDASVLFKKVYEEHFGQHGGQPYGALIGDYAFGPGAKDVALLEHLSHVAANAFAPFLAAADASMFGLETLADLNYPRDLSAIFESDDYYNWRRFRASDDSRFVGLCVPRILLRPPHGPETCPAKSFNYVEEVGGEAFGGHLWGNAAYALAVRITDAFARYFWCERIQGIDGGGLVADLPRCPIMAVDDATARSTEVAFPGRREWDLSRLGFIALMDLRGTEHSVFFRVCSCHNPKARESLEATASCQILTQLPYIFAISRFAHYLKLMAFEQNHQFLEPADLARSLQGWISSYITTETDPRARSRFPLAGAQIDVNKKPGDPRTWVTTARLRLHDWPMFIEIPLGSFYPLTTIRD